MARNVAEYLFDGPRNVRFVTRKHKKKKQLEIVASAVTVDSFADAKLIVPELVW